MTFAPIRAPTATAPDPATPHPERPDGRFIFSTEVNQGRRPHMRSRPLIDASTELVITLHSPSHSRPRRRSPRTPGREGKNARLGLRIDVHETAGIHVESSMVARTSLAITFPVRTALTATVGRMPRHSR